MTAWLLDHLWQSTWFALVFSLVTLLFRKNAAGVRYWLWLTASIKFLVPFSVLMLLGNQFGVLTSQDSRVAEIDKWIESTLAPASARQDANAAAFPAPNTDETEPEQNETAADGAGTRKAGTERVLMTLGALWLSGTIAVLGYWFFRWAELRRLVRAARPVTGPVLDSPVPVFETTAMLEPGIFGIFRPVLLLPQGITNHLSEPELQAVMAHELVHWQRRDNFTASIHMLVEAIFWFHPLVWWIGRQLVSERECACDETVSRLTGQPEAYAEALISVCQYYVAPRMPCAASMSSSNLRRRVESVLANVRPESLGITQKGLLITLTLGALIGPVLIGAIEPSEAQTTGPEAASSTSPAIEWTPIVQELYQDALREEQVYVFGFEPVEVDWIAEAFAEDFPGIQVVTGGALQNLQFVMSSADSAQPRFDVVSTSMLEAYALHEGGYLAPIDWSEFGVPDNRVGLDGTFGYSDNIVYTVAWDTRRVPGDDNKPTPTNWRDLLAPEYRDRMGTNSFIMPRLLGGLSLAWGEQETRDFARELTGNQELLLQFGDSREVFQNLDRSQMYFVGMVHSLTEEWQRMGRPTAYTIPEPVIMEQKGPAVMATAPHPAAARLISGWMASPRGMQARKELFQGSDLLPDSDEALARELRARGVTIVYDTPENAANRAKFAAEMQPIFDQLLQQNLNINAIRITPSPAPQNLIDRVIDVLITGGAARNPQPPGQMPPSGPPAGE